MKLQLHSASIEKISTMADRSIQLKIGLPELSADEMADLFSAHKEGVVEMEFEVENWEKSPSKRLHDRLFVYHKELKVEKDFNEWYVNTLDKIGQQYLDKLT